MWRSGYYRRLHASVLHAIPISSCGWRDHRHVTWLRCNRLPAAIRRLGFWEVGRLLCRDHPQQFPHLGHPPQQRQYDFHHHHQCRSGGESGFAGSKSRATLLAPFASLGATPRSSPIPLLTLTMPSWVVQLTPQMQAIIANVGRRRFRVSNQVGGQSPSTQGTGVGGFRPDRLFPGKREVFELSKAGPGRTGAAGVHFEAHSGATQM